MGDLFQAWAVRYAERFGLTNDSELKALLSWEDSLGASIEELDVATAEISRDVAGTLGKTESRFVGKMSAHLEALTTAVTRLRSVRYERGEDKPAEKEWGTCTACGSTGWVQVPHARCVQRGEWVPLIVCNNDKGVYYTMSVLCSCALGRWVGEHRGGQEKGAMTLTGYNRINPNWREQMKRRRLSETSTCEAREALKPDARWEAQKRRLIEWVFKSANDRMRREQESF